MEKENLGTEVYLKKIFSKTILVCVKFEIYDLILHAEQTICTTYRRMSLNKIVNPLKNAHKTAYDTPRLLLQETRLSLTNSMMHSAMAWLTPQHAPPHVTTPTSVLVEGCKT